MLAYVSSQREKSVINKPKGRPCPLPGIANEVVQDSVYFVRMPDTGIGMPPLLVFRVRMLAESM